MEESKLTQKSEALQNNLNTAMQNIQSEKGVEMTLQETINNLKLQVKMLTEKNNNLTKEQQAKQEALKQQIKALVQQSSTKSLVQQQNQSQLDKVKLQIAAQQLYHQKEKLQLSQQKSKVEEQLIQQTNITKNLQSQYSVMQSKYQEIQKAKSQVESLNT